MFEHDVIPRTVFFVMALLGQPALAAPSITERSFSCLIEANQTVKLASSALGIVAELTVDRGDLVQKGQILGKLDDRVEAANLALARAKALNNFDIIGHLARLDWLQKKFGRADELSTTRIVSRNTRDEAESDMKVEEQQLHLAKLQRAVAELESRQAEAILAQRTILSPISGVVVERLLSVGEYRNDQSPILTLAEIDPLRVEVFIPSIYFGQLMVGSKAHVVPGQPLATKHEAAVTVVDRVIDAASGTFGVRLKLPNSNFGLPAGLKCEVTFDAEPQQAR